MPGKLTPRLLGIKKERVILMDKKTKEVGTQVISLSD